MAIPCAIIRLHNGQLPLRGKDKSMKKRALTILILCACLLLAACGTKNAPPSIDLPREEAEEDGQNPVMNFVGVYNCERAEILVEAQGKSDAAFTVSWGGSYNERAVWTMSGTLDTETLSVSYDNAVKKIVTTDENGTDTAEEVYTDGRGVFTFNGENWSLTWTDETENAAEGMVFLPCYATGDELQETDLDAGDPDYYKGVSAMDKNQLEQLAASIRLAYLEEDWDTLSRQIRYPVTILGTELTDADAFLRFMADKTVTDGDREAMAEESCRDMFFNGQGLCLAGGQIWLLDPSYMTDNEPRLEIIAISGITEK